MVISKSLLNACLAWFIWVRLDIQDDTLLTVWSLKVSWWSKITPRSLAQWVGTRSLPSKDKSKFGILAIIWRLPRWIKEAAIIKAPVPDLSKVFVQVFHNRCALLTRKSYVKFVIINMSWICKIEEQRASRWHKYWTGCAQGCSLVALRFELEVCLRVRNLYGQLEIYWTNS